MSSAGSGLRSREKDFDDRFRIFAVKSIFILTRYVRFRGR